MKELVITPDLVREDITRVENLFDVAVVSSKVEYLANDAADRLNLALIEANELLVAARALTKRAFLIKSDDQP